MTQLERRDTRIRRAKQAAAAPLNRHGRRAFSDNDSSEYAGLDVHHSMSKERKNPVHLLGFVAADPHDPAKKASQITLLSTKSFMASVALHSQAPRPPALSTPWSRLRRGRS